MLRRCGRGGAANSGGDIDDCLCERALMTDIVWPTIHVRSDSEELDPTDSMNVHRARLTHSLAGETDEVRDV